MRTLGWGLLLAVVAVALLAAVWILGSDDGKPGGGDAVDRAERPGDDAPDTPVLKGRAETEAGSAQASPSAGHTRGEGLTIVGRLQDTAGEPAAGADVALEIADGVVTRGGTDVEGRFCIAFNTALSQPYLWLHLRATHGGTASLFHPFGVSREDLEKGQPHDVGTLRLLPAVAVGVTVHLPRGAVLPATVWLGATLRGNGLRTCFAEAKTDPDGRVRFEAVPHGPWRILAAAAGAGRGQLFLKLPRPEGHEVEIDLPPERVVTVVVTDRDTQAPIENARVELQETVRSPQGNIAGSCFWPRNVAPTNAAGVTEIRGLPPEGWFGTAVEADGYPRFRQRYGSGRMGYAPIRAEDTEVSVVLAKGRTIRWPIATGEVPVPANGTRITLRVAPGSGVDVVPEGGVVTEGHVEVEGCAPTHFGALAELPDGALASLRARAEEDTGPEIRFSLPRSIQVTLQHPDGEPATGYYVKVANQGNNVLTDAVAVDEEGRATVTGLHANPDRKTLVEVRVALDGTPWGGFKIATLDLSTGDREVTGIVPRTRPVTIVIRRAGESGLPESAGVNTSQWGQNPGLRVGVTPTSATADQVDWATGVVRFDWQPVPGSTKGRVYVALVGYVPHSEEFQIPSGTDPLTFEVDLELAAALDVHVEVPEDGRTRINLHRWDGEKRTWENVFLAQMAMGGYAKPDANGDIRLEPLAPGRYRVVDTTNHAASEAFDVEAGGEPTRVVMDVSKSGFIRGRVEVPEGYNAKTVRVLAEGLENHAPAWQSAAQGTQPKVAHAQCRENGEFWLRVPGDRQVTLRPEAAGLEPAAEGGSLTLGGPREGVVLTLVEGRVARVRFREPLKTRSYPYPGRPEACDVRLYRGEPDGEAVLVLSGLIENEGRSLAFSGFEPGTWTVWIDARPFAPVVLEGVALGLGTTHLGEVEVHRGSTIVVDLVLPKDQDMPRMYGSATREGQPTYSRQTGAASGGELRITGLGPGTYRVHVGIHMGGGAGLDETVEVDGANEVHLTLDLTR